MINYSIVMRSVNTNLIDINKAKGRINTAIAAGEQPQQEDLDLVASETQKAYAIAQYSEVMTIEQFAKHISTHGCVYSRADISAILYLAVDCMREQLLDGKKIRLGDLGDFSVSISSKGTDTAEKFSAQNITAVNVQWECGKNFNNLIADAEFNLVASRKAQAAVLKAIKAGETVVDLNKPAGNVDEDPDKDPTDPSGTSGESGSSEQGSGSSSSSSSNGSSSSSGSNGSSQGSGAGGASSSNGKYKLTLSTNNAELGSTTPTGINEYEPGTTVTIKANIIDDEAFFDGWSDGNEEQTRQIVMDKDYTLEASFSK